MENSALSYRPLHEQDLVVQIYLNPLKTLDIRSQFSEDLAIENDVEGRIVISPSRPTNTLLATSPSRTLWFSPIFLWRSSGKVRRKISGAPEVFLESMVQTASTGSWLRGVVSRAWVWTFRTACFKAATIVSGWSSERPARVTLRPSSRRISTVRSSYSPLLCCFFAAPP